jgi:hypothetical protein
MYSEHSLLLTYLNPTGQRYHNCSELQRVVDWTVTGTTQDGEPVLNLTVVPVPSRVSEGGVCASAVVKGLAYGTARVDATLQVCVSPRLHSLRLLHSHTHTGTAHIQPAHAHGTA